MTTAKSQPCLKNAIHLKNPTQIPCHHHCLVMSTMRMSFFSDDTTSSTSCSKMSDTEINCLDDQKYLVFRSCLSSLFKNCLVCGEWISNIEESTCGSLLSIKSFCINGHESVWNSQTIHQPDTCWESLSISCHIVQWEHFFIKCVN